MSTATANWKRQGFATLTPRLTFKDSVKAIEFYEKAFGAKRGMVNKGPDGAKTMHAEVQICDSMLMLVDEFPEMGCHAPESTGQAPACSMMLYFENVDAAFEKAVAAGCTVRMPVSDMFWGDRYGMVVDPFGYVWELGTHKEDLTESEIQARAAEAFKNMPGCSGN